MACDVLLVFFFNWCSDSMPFPGSFCSASVLLEYLIFAFAFLERRLSIILLFNRCNGSNPSPDPFCSTNASSGFTDRLLFLVCALCTVHTAQWIVHTTLCSLHTAHLTQQPTGNGDDELHLHTRKSKL